MGILRIWSHRSKALFLAASTHGFLVASSHALEVGGDPRVHPQDFTITTFASGLNYPVGMAALPDGSLLVAVSDGASFGSSTTGRLIRLADTNDDGIADSQTVLAHDVPGGGLSTVRIAGELVFTTGQSKPISIYRLGAIPTDTLTWVGRLDILYTGSWQHEHSALAVRPAPVPGGYDLVFQLGSEANFAATTRTLALTSTIGVSGTLHGDALYSVRIVDHGDFVTGSDLTQLATGLRNAAGFDFHPTTGDLYLEDNGIDGVVNANEPTSADELNVIPATAFGGAIEDFGFPNSYIEYRTGTFVGGQGIPPIVAFQPIPDPQTGSESEGPNDIAFAPRFPPGLRNGIFVGFHGRQQLAGEANEENPLVYFDLDSQTYFHFVGNDQPVGHIDGLLATGSDLYAADIASNGNLGSPGANLGVIYRIRAKASAVSAPEPMPPAGAGNMTIHPNPVSRAAWIELDVANAGAAVIQVFDVSGKLVETLANRDLSKGAHRFTWNAEARAPGLYFHQVAIGDRVTTRKVLVIR